MSTSQITVRLPEELKAWAEARAFLKSQSLNSTIVELLNAAIEADPLAKLAVIEKDGRHVVASVVSGERFRAFVRKDMALAFAREALSLGGAETDYVLEAKDYRNLPTAEAA